MTTATDHRGFERTTEIRVERKCGVIVRIEQKWVKFISRQNFRGEYRYDEEVEWRAVDERVRGRKKGASEDAP